jgi:hypothetical protein
MKKLLFFLSLLMSFHLAFSQKTVTTKTVTTVKNKSGAIEKADSTIVTYTVLPDSISVPVPYPVYKDTCITDPVPVNQPPSANAGPNREVTLPTNTLSVTGSGSDPENGPLTYKWTRTATGEVVSNSATASLAFSVAGNYIYTFTVTDNKGATATDQLTVVVNPAIVVDTPTGTPQSFTLAALASDYSRPESGAATTTDASTLVIEGPPTGTETVSNRVTSLWGQSGVSKFGGLIQLSGYTVATLPSDAQAGDLAYVTDADSPTWNATVVGSGSETVMVMYDGTNWKVR